MALPGATHKIAGSEQLVKATRWLKDGDHPKVVRYPIERREFKGLLIVDAKTQHALRFGEWIIEDENGRIWVEASNTQKLPREKYVPLEGVRT